jgi:hypothetical protein
MSPRHTPLFRAILLLPKFTFGSRQLILQCDAAGKINLKLNENEIELIKKWISQGAVYKPHWAFIAPKQHEIPEVKLEDWPQNEIDYFILARQEQKNLEPNDIADKERLLKRLSFDITGLPPTIEMQERFLADDAENAYEKIVDELLAKPQYGEKNGCILDGRGAIRGLPWLSGRRPAHDVAVARLGDSRF